MKQGRAATSTAARSRAASRSSCKPGEHTLEGDKALALARIRNNVCDPDEDDTRPRRAPAAHPQRDQGPADEPAALPDNFIKGPWIGWNAPKAFISDMGGFTLPQVAIAAIFGGSGYDQRAGREPDGTLHVSPAPTAAS